MRFQFSIVTLAAAWFLGGSLATAKTEWISARVESVLHAPPLEFRVARIDGVSHFNVEDLALLCRASRIWRADLGRMELATADHKVTLRLGSPFVGVDAATRNLFSPVLWVEGQMLVPTTFLTEVMDPLLEEHFDWDEGESVLRLLSSEPNLIAVTYAASPTFTDVEVRSTEELKVVVRESFGRKSRVNVKCPGGVLSEKFLGTFPGAGLVESLATSQTGDVATLEFHLSPEADRMTRAEVSSPTRIRFRFEVPPPDPVFTSPLDSLGNDSTSVGESEIPPVQEPEEPSFYAPARVLRRVVIDPGHGGSDAGSSSERGEREKDLTLEIARRVRDALGELAPEVSVQLTREDDRFLSNEDRRRFANQSRADAFVSVHCDGWFDEKRRGFTVATWGIPAVDPYQAIPVGGVRVGEAPRDVDVLAGALEREIDDSVSLPNRGRTMGPFAVLEGLTMPGVLVECGVLTHPEDRKLLLSDSFVGKISDAIAAGILEYRGRLGRPAFRSENSAEDQEGSDE